MFYRIIDGLMFAVLCSAAGIIAYGLWILL